MNDSNYVKLPNALMKLEKITGNHKILIAIIIGYYCNDSFCFVSKKKLASLMGIHERTVYKLLEELKEHDYLYSIKVSSYNGKNTVSILIPTNRLIKELSLSLNVDNKIHDAIMIGYNGNAVELYDSNYEVIKRITGS